jgi:hypothetical protein
MIVKFCDRCGIRLADAADGTPAAHGGVSHDRCQAAREFEPPRYCADCGRRLVVQVIPNGWTARCATHGELSHRGR